MSDRMCLCEDNEWCDLCSPALFRKEQLEAEVEQLTRDLGEARTAARLLYVWFNGDMHDDEDRKFLRQFPWIQESRDGT